MRNHLSNSIKPAVGALELGYGFYGRHPMNKDGRDTPIEHAAMKPNQSIPPATVIPVLMYPDVRAAVAWLTSAFGFAERVRIGESHRAQMSIGHDGAVIIADVRGEQRPPDHGIVTHLIKIRVKDVDAQFERACSNGARLVEPPIDRVYGERDCTLDDLAGHRWQFTQTMRDVRPEEYGCETVDPWRHGET